LQIIEGAVDDLIQRLMASMAGTLEKTVLAVELVLHHGLRNAVGERAEQEIVGQRDRLNLVLGAGHQTQRHAGSFE
jgi:hypothetical protein